MAGSDNRASSAASVIFAASAALLRLILQRRGKLRTSQRIPEGIVREELRQPIAAKRLTDRRVAKRFSGGVVLDQPIEHVALHELLRGGVAELHIRGRHLWLRRLVSVRLADRPLSPLANRGISCNRKRYEHDCRSGGQSDHAFSRHGHLSLERAPHRDTDCLSH